MGVSLVRCGGLWEERMYVGGGSFSSALQRVLERVSEREPTGQRSREDLPTAQPCEVESGQVGSGLR